MAASAAPSPTISFPPCRKLLDRASPPEHIVIETSGLALPQPLVRAFNWPEIRSRVTVDGVVTVVDGAALAEGRFAADEAALAAQRAADPNLDHDSPIEELFEDQLDCADMVLLNKTDLVEAEPSRTDEIGTGGRSSDPAPVSSPPPTAGSMSRSSSALASGAEDDLASRPSHHEMEGEAEHDHDDFESFVVPVRPISDKRGLSRPHPRPDRQP